MLKMFSWLACSIVFLVLAAALLSCISHVQKPQLGLRGSRLTPCPSTPNCVCSEHADEHSFVAPLRHTGPPERAWQRAAESITGMGGTILHNDGQYLHAVFTSPFFRFVDDMELRLDDTQGTIQLRSASRVGYSDLGVNRKRVARLRALFGQP